MSEKTIYKTLAPFFDAVDGTEEKALKFTAPGYMDLCIEALGYNDHEGRPVYSVAHYGEQNGDAMRDPDIIIMADGQNAWPISYRNDYIGVFNEAVEYDDEGRLIGYRKKMQADITDCADLLLKNIADQQGI